MNGISKYDDNIKGYEILYANRQLTLFAIPLVFIYLSYLLILIVFK